MNNGPSLMSRIGRGIIVAIVLFIGYFTINNTIGFEGLMNKGSDTIASGFDSLADTLDGSASPNVSPGDRPYEDTNEESLEILAENIGSFTDKDGYERDAFGSGWNSVTNENSIGWEKFPEESCHVRRAVLIEQGENVEYDEDCDITSGTWTDPYGERNEAGEVVYHTSTVSRDFDIDHVVALSLAWRSGAAHLDDDTRNQISNDKANLLISDAGINRSKGDQDIVDWTPPVDSVSYCDYTDRYAHVKAKYDLTVTEEEFNKIEEIITTCNS